MKKLFFILAVMFVTMSNAQVTHLNTQFKICGKCKVRPIKVEIQEHYTIVKYEIIALEKIKWLNVGAMTKTGGHISFSNGQKLPILGQYSYDTNTWRIHPGESSWWGWDNLSPGEKVHETLCFKGTIPPGVISINDIGGLGVNTDGDGYRPLFYNLKINNPRKYYTSYASEDEIKKNILENNDGICGIYEIVGNQSKSKVACVNNQGQHLLVFISDNNENSWWRIGDVRAYLIPTASKGMFKASWIDKYKNKNEDAYAAFDGASLKVKILSGSDKGEHTYIKMYPTEAPMNTKLEEAVSLLEDEDFQGAIKMLSEIINNKKSYDAYMLRAYAFTSLEFYKSAIEDYTKALECKPGDEDAYYARGMIKLQIQDVTGIDDLKMSGEFGRALLREYDLLDYDTNKTIKKEQAPPLKKQSIPQLKKTNR